MGNAMIIPHRMHLSWEVITAFECRFYLISSSSPITCHVGCLFRSALDSQPFIAARPPYPSATESENGCRKTPTNHSSLSHPSVSVCLSPDNWDPFLQVCPDHCIMCVKPLSSHYIEDTLQILCSAWQWVLFSFRWPFLVMKLLQSLESILNRI